MKKIKYCLDCEKQIDNRSLKCSRCSKLGRIGWSKGLNKFNDVRIFRISEGQKGRKVWNKGIPFRHKGSFKEGISHINWKGGKTNKEGYIMLLCKDHPYADRDGYVHEHRIIIENHLSRYLSKNEEVHHIDFDVSNNSIDNLYLFRSKSEHSTYHHFLRRCVSEFIQKEGLKYT